MYMLWSADISCLVCNILIHTNQYSRILMELCKVSKGSGYMCLKENTQDKFIVTMTGITKQNKSLVFHWCKSLIWDALSGKTRQAFCNDYPEEKLNITIICLWYKVQFKTYQFDNKKNSMCNNRVQKLYTPTIRFSTHFSDSWPSENL